MLCLSCYAYVFSSTKLEIRAEQVLPGREGGWVVRWKSGRGREREEGGEGAGWRNDPNNVCTCE
jgi:hypothetical protein